jgi:acetolactate decarboxylase
MKTGFGPHHLLLISAILIVLAGCAPLPAPVVTAPAAPASDNGGITQISTYPALDQGLYDGDVTYAELAQMGNFGLGTFDYMDGEMVALDGQFYQARSDGSVGLAKGSAETPFATVLFFASDRRLQQTGPLTGIEQLKAYLDKVGTPENRPYAVQIAGKFPYLKIRSVPRQSRLNVPLTDVVAQQVMWEKQDISGTLVGYWFPQYLSGMDPPGYHLHFISDDRQVAGHVLDVNVDGATVDIDYHDQVTLRLPGTAAFGTAELSKP